MKCSLCEEKIETTEAYFGDKGTFYEDKPLCETCYYEDEPYATILYKKDDEPYVISHTRDETEGDFSVSWHSTDPWRGYYETKSEKYALVNTAELLSYHESEEMLKNFDDRIRALFDEHDIDYARVFARSSNVFYSNYDLYVKKEQELLGRLLVAKAKAEVDYSNPKWYRNIVFDEDALSKLSQLFPERQIKTDYNATRLIEELGDDALPELQNRLRKNTNVERNLK
jgi:hypothetical protein